MTALFNHGDLVKDAFLIKEKNEAGIYAVRLFFRARPVVIVIDDAILMINDQGRGVNHRFGKINPNFNTIWPIIMEKAFAKLKGNYLQLHGGFMSNVFKAILGVPSSIDYMKSFRDDDKLWSLMKSSYDSKYPMGLSTEGDDDSKKNECGVTKNHAFGVLSVFHLDHGGKTHSLVIARNPRHKEEYKLEFNHNDLIWNDNEARRQVPFNIDPRRSW